MALVLYLSGNILEMFKSLLQPIFEHMLYVIQE